MSKRILALVICVLMAPGLPLAQPPQPTLRTTKLSVGIHVITAEIASTPQSRTIGLMMRERLAPRGGGKPTGALAQAISDKWGSYAQFKEAFSKSAVGNFGSGWTWLVVQSDGVAIVNTDDADNPLTKDDEPLLTIDVWEHAYYIDYRNERPKFVEAFLKNLVSWDFAQRNYENALSAVAAR